MAAVVSDEDLMRLMRGGSPAAFDTLYSRYREAVWQFFRRRTDESARAEELAQDTFVAILDGAARYEGRGSFRSYLFGTAYHVLMADRRKAAFRLVKPLEAEPADPRSQEPDPGIWVRDALGTLDRDDREILMLREYDQLSYQEIADLRNIPVNTVRSQLFRARAALRAALDARTSYAPRTSHGH